MRVSTFKLCEIDQFLDLFEFEGELQKYDIS